MTGMLEGLKVADLSIVTAGAAATQVLADFGADVVKIESGSRPDMYRMGFTGDQGGNGDLDFPPFRVANRNKRGLSVNLKDSEGREVARRLIAQSDVVVENFRRGVIERLGLGFQELITMRPNIVLVSISSQGATGPNRGYTSFGTTLDALGGIQSLSGYDESTPTWSSGRVNYPDQTANMISPAVIIAAVMASRADGKPRWIDLSQREVVTSLLGEQILKTSVDGVNPVPAGNSAPGETAWVSPCVGEDCWVAVSLTSAADRARLAVVLGIDVNESMDEASQTAALRASTDSWASVRTKESAAVELQAAGLAAVPVNSGEELLEDPYLRERGWWQPVEKPDGEIEQQRGWVVQFTNGGPSRVRKRAPHVGEETYEVLLELGYTEAEIALLHQRGVVTSSVRVPVGAE
ncbi:CaiB/BaiF CoA-transferase family protein [Arthrobacter sp. W4I7]|uniref:CaiB/BaiF CoA transferase family protein n=1 Tax=Arthrobacter sp. W4I7 TaxID=3042296 RepID=UPI0027815D6D|nr:CoA transferase [Arthrobacter sp. W4I7]MDQ0691329.1 crotonobetainyl-CoA:carnitine CoA-transferase CaiB-like acyl-CoA transferase [Arthrobacter sp. W4I7]